MDSRPGEFNILKKEEILRSGFTTHDLSPNMFIEYLENETNADIYMLAVQPENVSFGEGVSESVSRAIERIVDLVKEDRNA
jgi:hydrogenase 3 maturation protease